MRGNKANYYHSEKPNSFSDIMTFQEPISGAGLAVSLENETELCGYSLQRDDLYLNLPNATSNYIEVEKARNRFLDPGLSSDSKILSVATSATMAINNMAESVDSNFCQLHKNVVANKLNLVTSNLQQLQDNNGEFLQTFTAGKTIFTLS